MTKAKLGLWIALAGSLVAACTAGTVSEPGPSTTSRDIPPFLRDDPGSTRNPPGTTRDNPGTTRDQPGRASSCPPCDGNFRCSAAVNVQDLTYVVQLTTQQDGTCGSNGTSLRCDGGVTDKQGVLAGSWVATSGGGFRIVEVSGVVDCTPTTDAPSQGGGTATLDGG